MFNRSPGHQHLQNRCVAYLALEHSLKCMNAELNFFSIHRLVIRDDTLGDSITETLYAELKKVSHAKGRHPSIQEVPSFRPASSGYRACVMLGRNRIPSIFSRRVWRG